MKKLAVLSILGFLLLGLFVSVSSVEAKTVKVKGYFKPSTMKYVAPSYRTSPNKTKLDNYSTKGNYNPYSGKKGTVKPYKYRY
ncbi:MAG: hypothetical protein WCW54_00680 [Candidatus Paceibacterota bacterium]